MGETNSNIINQIRLMSILRNDQKYPIWTETTDDELTTMASCQFDSSQNKP